MLSTNLSFVSNSSWDTHYSQLAHYTRCMELTYARLCLTQLTLSVHGVSCMDDGWCLHVLCSVLLLCCAALYLATGCESNIDKCQGVISIRTRYFLFQT